MRRTPNTDTVHSSQAEGAATDAGFDRAFRELATARAAYDASVGNPDRVPELAVAATRLANARRAMRTLRPVA